MRGLLVSAVLAAWLLTAPPVYAGLYNTEEHLLNVLTGRPSDYTRALVTLQQIVAVELTNNPKSSRAGVLQRVKNLEQELHDGTLSLQDRVNLSAYYVRLNDPEKAIALLEALPADRRNWMALSNLATAYQLAGNLDRAEQYLVQALDAWPIVSTDASGWRLNWLRVVEGYQLRLIRSRQAEQRGGRGTAGGLDAVFPRLRFVGPSGEYEAGLLAPDQWANLPANYTEIVKLLVLWMPHDARLRWLLAEIVNANDDPELALEMMNELVETRKFGNTEFAAHHRELRHAKMIRDRLKRLRPSFANEKAKASLAPLGDLLGPAPAAVLDTAGAVMAIEKIIQEPLPKEEQIFDVAPTDPAANAPVQTGTWTPEWRQIGISFVAGAIVAALLSLQLREMRKRKRDAQPASQE
jgi:hypothetical protein